MRPQLIALDLDGTLLNEASQVPDGHRAAIAEFQAADVPVVIVTGRPLLTTRGVWQDLALGTPLACFNGVWVGHPNEEPFACQALSEADVRGIVAEVTHPEVAICAYPTPDTWLIDRHIERTQSWPSLYGAEITEAWDRIHDWRGSSCKVMVVGSPDFIPELALSLRLRFGGRFHVSVSQPDRFEIIAPAANKAWGLEQLAKALSVPREAVWACGDAANDSEMLAWAGTGFAMGQAPEAVQAVADHILPSIDDAGLQALVPMLQA